MPGFIMCSVERMATEWRTFFAFDHCRAADSGSWQLRSSPLPPDKLSRGTCRDSWRIAASPCEAALRNTVADLLHRAGRADEAMTELKRAVAIFAEVGEPGKLEPEIWTLSDW